MLIAGAAAYAVVVGIAIAMLYEGTTSIIGVTGINGSKTGSGSSNGAGAGGAGVGFFTFFFGFFPIAAPPPPAQQQHSKAASKAHCQSCM
jgi:hypothetical protein